MIAGSHIKRGWKSPDHLHVTRCDVQMITRLFYCAIGIVRFEAHKNLAEFFRIKESRIAVNKIDTAENYEKISRYILPYGRISGPVLFQPGFPGVYGLLSVGLYIDAAGV